MMKTEAIEIKNLAKTYENGVTALTSVTLTVPRGEVFGYLGPNGSGKTTTVRTLNGTLKPSSGEFEVLGIDGTEPENMEEIRSRTATVTESGAMYEHLTVTDNLRFYAGMYGIGEGEADRRSRDLLGFMGLWEKRDLKLGSFSTGMKKRVALVRALLHGPELLFLDEPTSGLDPESSRQVLGLISRLAADEGRTVFLCTHNLPEAEQICSSFGFIRRGMVAAVGTKELLVSGIEAGVTVSIRTDKGAETFQVAKESEIHPLVVKKIERGEKIIEVNRERPSLEEVYFHYIRENGNGKSKNHY